MFKKLVIFAALFVGLGSPLIARAASLGGGTPAPTPTPVAPTPTPVSIIEFYHAGFDHYFITADASEITALDTGVFTGWTRTGKTFTAFAPTPASASLDAVCRFYGRPEAGLDSHFYSAASDECAAVLAKFSSSWQFESNNVFQTQLPNRATGACPTGTTAVYRLFNNRRDANHRYTNDPNVKQAMVSTGYISEGYGPDGVAFCSKEASTSSLSANFLVTQLAPDFFDFGSTATPTLGATIAAYVWNFGDGATGSGAATSHLFTTSGTFPVVLTVTDSSGAVGFASRSVTAAVTTPTPTPGPTPTPRPASDFDTRKAAPGVIRWFDFDTTAQLGGGYSANFGTLPGSRTSAVIDTTVSASGAGSMRFDVPSLSNDNAAGTWWANFSPDLLTQFGENSEFYVQWRQRFNQAFIDTFFTDIDGGGKAAEGIKQAIVTVGDQPGRLFNSCEAIGNVVQTYYQHRFPIVYNSCTGSASHPPYSGFYERVTSPTSDYLLQNGTAPFCTYSAAQANPTSVSPGCFGWVANEWLTFQLGTTVGPRNLATNEFDNSRVRLWAAREGQPAQLLVDWKPGVGGYFPLTAGSLADNQRYGKIWLLPYMTRKDATQVHPLAQTWYDELIISRQRIADPGFATPTPTPTPTPAPAPASPAALTALPANTALNLGTYRCTDVAGENAGYCAYVTDFSGMRYDENRQRMVIFGGGHASTSYDGLNTFDLRFSLNWIEEYLPTACASHVDSNYDRSTGTWLSGTASGPFPRPVSRHTEDLMVVVGDELIMLGKVEGNGSGCPNVLNFDNYFFASSAKIAHYNFVTKSWSFSAMEGFSQWPGTAYDPISSKVIALGQTGLEVYDPVTKTKTLPIDFATYAGIARLRDEQGNALNNVVSYNNNLVYFPPNQKLYYFERVAQAVFEVNLNRANLSQSTITRLTTIGTPPPANVEVGYGYDSKNRIIGGGPVQNKFYAFDPVTKTWTSNVVQGGTPGSVAFHALDYDPVNNAFIFITDNASGRKTWAYRYAP